MTTKKRGQQDDMRAKEILDRWATTTVREDAVWVNKEGKSQIDRNKDENYVPEKYDTDISLWTAPKDCIRIEFEFDHKTNIRCISEIESACKTLKIDHCVTEHQGGKSPYINIFNIKGIPLNDDNPIAKNLLIDLIMPGVVKEGLDRSNLGWTLSPVIGHPHWKKKYNGAIHKIIRGKHPLEHDNEYPKSLLKQIKASKKWYKQDIVNTQQKNPWVIDFLLNYCVKQKLPVGNRNHVIEKNMAVLLVHHQQRDKLMSEYFHTQERKHNSLKGWFNKVIKGEIKQVSIGELKRYIKDNDIPYEIPHLHKREEEPEELSKEEKKEAEEYLAKPSLLVDTIKEIQKNVAGEEDTIAALIIITTTRLVNNAIPESTNLLLSDKTGLGKDHVTKKTLEVIIPEDDHLHVTKMTPESFTYWHYKEEGWTWDKKVIHFEDITQQLLNCSTFKTMSSGENYAVIVKDQETIEIPINGKPCMVLTSHHANPKDEALRRFRIGALNDTSEQTEKIITKISRRYAGIEKNIKNEMLRKALWNLEPYTVVIPFAELIKSFFPDNTLMRTQYACFLDYIAGSCVFHQYQRKLTKNRELIAEPDDYMIARMVLIYTTSNPLMIPMSKEYRDILKILREKGESMTVKEIEVSCDQSQPWLYKHLPRIAATKLVKKGKQESEKANKPVTTYQYAPHLNTRMIPTWNEIKH